MAKGKARADRAPVRASVYRHLIERREAARVQRLRLIEAWQACHRVASKLAAVARAGGAYQRRARRGYGVEPVQYNQLNQLS